MTTRWNSPKVVDAPTTFRAYSPRRSIDATNRYSSVNLPGPSTNMSSSSSTPRPSSAAAAASPFKTMDAVMKSGIGGKRRSASPCAASTQQESSTSRTGRRMSPHPADSLFTSSSSRTSSPFSAAAPSPHRELSQRRPLSRDARPITSLTPEGKQKPMSVFCVEVGRGRGLSPSHRNHVVTVGPPTGNSTATPITTTAAAAAAASSPRAEHAKPTRLFWKNKETSAESDKGHWKPVLSIRCPSPRTQSLVGVMSPSEMPSVKPYKLTPPYRTDN